MIGSTFVFVGAGIARLLLDPTIQNKYPLRQNLRFCHLKVNWPKAKRGHSGVPLVFSRGGFAY
ncbi:MAG: hypothetical protein IJO88_05405, partial [Oscillospiraceae bacterium]|nr:hypothetical protein [Oscillospiraceae bacterium]